MEFESYEPSDDFDYGNINESKRNRNETKKYQTQKKQGDNKKTGKIHGNNPGDRRRSDTYHSKSKNPSIKTAGNQKIYHNNDKIKYKNDHFNNSSKYKGEQYSNRKYPSSERQNKRSKTNFEKREREFSKSDRFSKKSNVKSNNYKNNKNKKEKTLYEPHNVPLNDVDHILNSGEDEEREYFDPNEGSNNYHQSKIAESEIGDESGISDENDFSDINEEVNKFKSPRDKVKHIRIVTRSMWDDEPGDPESDKLPMKPFNHINYVDTNSPMCENQEDCIDVMKLIKERESIKYNFYIGGDDFIYEGKGWVADVNEETGYNKRAVDVAFIGTFSAMRPPPPMLNVGYHFVNFGITNGKIIKNFSCDFLMCNHDLQVEP